MVLDKRGHEKQFRDRDDVHGHQRDQFRSWGCVSMFHYTHVFEESGTVVHGDDFMSGGPRHQLKMAGRSSRTKHFESKHTVMGGVQRGRMGEEVAREVTGGQEMNFVVALPVGSQFQEKGGGLSGRCNPL